MKSVIKDGHKANVEAGAEAKRFRSTTLPHCPIASNKNKIAHHY